MRTSGQRSRICGRGQPLVGDADGLGGRGIELELVHPRVGLRHAQVADHREAGVEAGLGLERLVELHRVVVDVAGGVAHVEERQQARGVPGRAGGQLVALEQHGVGPAGLAPARRRSPAPTAPPPTTTARTWRPHRLASLPSLPAVSSGRGRRRKAAGPTLGGPIPTRHRPAGPLAAPGRPRGNRMRCRTSPARRARVGTEEGDRHENAGIARRRGAGARRLRRHAEDRSP